MSGLRDVTITITDGLMGAGGNTGEGVHLKIGASPAVSEELIKITDSMDAKRIKLKLGLSPLANAAMDSVENGAALLYCMPVAPSVDGSVGEIRKTAEGKGTFTITGKPNGEYQIVVRITEAGGLNEALFQYSLNGGYSYSDELTVPVAGSYAVPDTGLTFVFAAASVDDTAFAAGDMFSAAATAPMLNNEDILAALDKIPNLKEEFELVHIVGPSAEATWAAVAEKQKELWEKYKRPLMFVLEAYSPNEGENAYDYGKRLIRSRRAVANTDLQVVAAMSRYVGMDGVTRQINNAGVVCGWYARTERTSQSIGETRSFSAADDKMLELLPAGIEEELSELDAAGFLTFREYIGLEGKYVSNAKMLCPEGSDYKYAEYVRTKNKILRLVRREALLQLQREIDPSNVDAELDAIAKFIAAPLDEMVSREISSYRTVVPAGQDILSTEKIEMTLRWVPKGYDREIEIDLGMENPYK